MPKNPASCAGLPPSRRLQIHWDCCHSKVLTDPRQDRGRAYTIVHQIYPFRRYMPRYGRPFHSTRIFLIHPRRQSTSPTCIANESSVSYSTGAHPLLGGGLLQVRKLRIFVRNNSCSQKHSTTKRVHRYMPHPVDPSQTVWSSLATVRRTGYSARLCFASSCPLAHLLGLCLWVLW